jgi:2-phospho-L-lactate guanylyltransferase
MSDAVWVVVVARLGQGAKSRLIPALDPVERRRLASAMLADVLGTCARFAPKRVVAVVDEPIGSRGVVMLEDSTSDGMNAAVSRGVLAARARGATTVIVLPGDVPRVSVRDLAELVAAAHATPRAVVVGASRDGGGTNALLLRPPEVIAPSFGPPSVDRHLRLGQQSGAATHLVRLPGLALDVDTPADLAALFDAPVGSHTAAVLRDLRVKTQALVRLPSGSRVPARAARA